MTKALIHATIGVFLVLSPFLNSWVTKKHDDAKWAWIVQVITAPGCYLFLLILAIGSIPYFLLYPERHAHIIDFKGTEEQKLALKEFRRASAQRGIISRALENLGLRPYSGPEWPDILNDIPQGGTSEDET